MWTGAVLQKLRLVRLLPNGYFGRICWECFWLQRENIRLQKNDNRPPLTRYTNERGFRVAVAETAVNAKSGS